MLYFGNAPPVAWADITHVDYSNPADPKPPHISLYTGLTSGQTFALFSVLWLLQIYIIWLKNYRTSPLFLNLSYFDQILHSFHSVIIPAPSVDWSIGDGDCEEHYQRLMFCDFFSSLALRLSVLSQQLESFTMSKKDHHLLNQKVNQRISVSRELAF